MINYAVFASGGGTDLQSAINAERSGEIKNGKIAVVISNKSTAGALERAKAAGIDAFFVDHTKPQEEVEKEILKILKSHDVKFIFLAGYLKKITRKIIDFCPIYNIHPALDLHRFGGAGMYGVHVHAAVIAAGEKISGATIHKVDEIYDNGVVLMQSEHVPVLSTDTPESLQARVLEAEHKLIPKFLNQVTCFE